MCYYYKATLLGLLEKRLTHMPFTHAFTGSNPVQVTIGAWFNGRASVSKTVDAGSIPAAPAMSKLRVIMTLFFSKI